MKPDRAEREALIDSLEVGDLVEINGRRRIVREVAHARSRDRAQVSHITLSIQRCSWTRRPYTVRNRCDLYLCQMRMVRKGYGAERGPLEGLLQKDIENHNLRLLECCDVVGVLS